MKFKLIATILLSFIIFSASAQSAKGQVYVIRYTGYEGGLVNYRVYIDSTLVCKLKNNTYSVIDVPAGDHEVVITSGGLPSVGKVEAQKISVSEGKINYVQIINAPDLYCQEVTQGSAEKILKKVKQVTDCLK